MRGFATADAEVLFGRALGVAEQAQDAELIGRAHLGRGQSREALGRFRAALDDHQAAASTARQAGDRRLEMQALREFGGHTAVAIGVSMDECTDRIRQGLRIAESLGDRAMQADLLGWLTVIAASRLRFADAVDFGRRAVRAGRAAGSDHALAAGLDGLKNAYAYLGEVDAVRAVVDELESLVRHSGDQKLLLWTLFEASLSDLGRADWAGAQEHIGAVIAMGRRNGYPIYESWFSAHLGWVARLQGKLDEAVEQGRRAVELAAAIDHPWFRPSAEAMLGASLIEMGATEEALAILTAARRRAERGGAEAYLLRCLAPLAQVSGDRGVLTEADALLAGISAPAGSAWLLGADAYLAVARAWLRHGEPARARAVVAPLLDAARRQHWRPVLATGGLVDGQCAMALGDVASARIALTAAAEIAERHAMTLVRRAARAALNTGSREAEIICGSSAAV